MDKELDVWICKQFNIPETILTSSQLNNIILWLGYRMVVNFDSQRFRWGVYEAEKRRYMGDWDDKKIKVMYYFIIKKFLELNGSNNNSRR